MTFNWSDLIARAKVYCDDDHNATDGWIKKADWLTLANVEYAQLYRKWVRMGLVRPKPTDTNFTVDATGVATSSLSGVLAIVGVGEDLGQYVRVLQPAQGALGDDPFWKGSTPYTSKAQAWAAHGSADALTLELDTADTATTYTVRWVPTVAYQTALVDGTSGQPTTIDLPYGGDERLVLGIARRALVKESALSRQLDTLMLEADAEMTFTAWGRVPGGPRVRRVQKPVRQFPGRFSSFPTDQRLWFYV